MYVKKKNKKKKQIKTDIFFFTKPIMVKCLNIGKNIGQPIYRSISNKDTRPLPGSFITFYVDWKFLIIALMVEMGIFTALVIFLMPLH